MPIRVRCPECGTPFSAPDAAAGTTVKCPDCLTPLTLPLPDAPPTARRAARPRPPAKSAPLALLLVVAGVGLLALAGAAVGAYLAFARGRPEPPPPVPPRAEEPRHRDAVATAPAPLPATVPPTEVVAAPRTAEPAPPPAAVPAAPSAPVAPPDAQRAEVGRLEKLNTVVVRSRSARPGEWEHVAPDDPRVFATDRLVCLPGYKTVVRLGEVGVDLWGNLPTLAAAPVLEASVTPYRPPDGLDADLTVHAGRVYLSTRRATGSAVRLRFRVQVWDVALADTNTKVVFQLLHELVPGATPEPPRTLAALAVRSGSATLTVPRRAPVTLPRYGEASWDSQGGAPQVRPEADAKARDFQDRNLAELQEVHDRLAKPTFEALVEFEQRIIDERRVRATFDAALQDRQGSSAKAVVAAQVAVLAFAALGDLPGLADALCDPSRRVVREAAVLGLQKALAREPALAGPFRRLLAEKYGLDDPDADEALRLLRGFTAEELVSGRTVDRLVGDLSSKAVPVRELAFETLRGYLDPAEEKSNRPLLAYDAGVPARDREPAAGLWREKAEGVKKKLAAPPR